MVSTLKWHVSMNLHILISWKISTEYLKDQLYSREWMTPFCKAELSNLFSDKIKQSDDSFTTFSSAIMNFYGHYCLDEYSSEWCHHDKVSLGLDWHWEIALLNFHVFLVYRIRATRKNTDLPVRHRLRSSVSFYRIWLHALKIISLMTTNTVEGSHRQALMYWDNLGPTLYVCKTNMIICHKVGCCNNKNWHKHCKM